MTPECDPRDRLQARARAEAALELAAEDSAAALRSIHEEVGRLEAERDSAVARLASAETAKLELRQEYERRLAAAAEDGSSLKLAAEDATAALRAEHERALKGARAELVNSRGEAEELRTRLEETAAAFKAELASLSKGKMRERIEERMQVSSGRPRVDHVPSHVHNHVTATDPPRAHHDPTACAPRAHHRHTPHMSRDDHVTSLYPPHGPRPCGTSSARHVPIEKKRYISRIAHVRYAGYVGYRRVRWRRRCALHSLRLRIRRRSCGSSTGSWWSSRSGSGLRTHALRSRSRYWRRWRVRCAPL